MCSKEKKMYKKLHFAVYILSTCGVSLGRGGGIQVQRKA